MANEPTTQTPTRTTRTGHSCSHCAHCAAAPRARHPIRSVLVLDDEVGAADRAGELRALPGELELRELLGLVHAVGELEPDGPLAAVFDRVHHVDREAALVEDVRHADAIDLKGRRLERGGGDDDVALLLENA